jgi:hypothetical protein
MSLGPVLYGAGLDAWEGEVHPACSSEADAVAALAAAAAAGGSGGGSGLHDPTWAPAGKQQPGSLMQGISQQLPMPSGCKPQDAFSSALPPALGAQVAAVAPDGSAPFTSGPAAAAQGRPEAPSPEAGGAALMDWAPVEGAQPAAGEPGLAATKRLFPTWAGTGLTSALVLVHLVAVAHLAGAGPHVVLGLPPGQ